MYTIDKMPKNTLSNEKVIEIIRDYQENGDTYENSKDIAILFGQYADLIHYASHRYYPSYANNPEYTDGIEAAGFRGVCTAISSFDCSKNVLFQTWAYRFILNEIREYISVELNNVSVYFSKNIRKVNNVIKDFELTGESYTDEDVIMRLEAQGISEKSVRDCLAYIHSKNACSIEAYNVMEEEGMTLFAALTSESEDYSDPAEIYVKKEEIMSDFDRLHRLLSDEEFDIASLYYVDQEKPAKIAELYGYDELTVSRIISALTTKIELCFAERSTEDITSDISEISFSSIFFDDCDDDDIDFSELKLG